MRIFLKVLTDSKKMNKFILFIYTVVFLSKR